MPLAGPAIGSFRFSTDDVPMRQRGDAIRGLRERGLMPLEPLPDHAVQVEITKWFLPGAGILSGTLCGLRQEGTPQAHTVNDDLFFTVNLTGRSLAIYRQREIAFGNGEAILLSCADGDFTISRPERVRFIGLRVPRRYVAPLVAGLDDRIMRPIPPAAQPLRLLTGYLGAIADLLDPPSPEMLRVVAGHVHDLIALSIGGARDAAASASVRAARLEAIRADIVANLEDCALTVTAVAARHGVTSRYVHKLFETEGTTFSQFILHQRLDRAYRMLRDQRLASRSVASIAFEVGFNDLSYFNRAFRRRYDATPSDIRAAGVTLI